VNVYFHTSLLRENYSDASVYTGPVVYFDSFALSPEQVQPLLHPDGSASFSFFHAATRTVRLIEMVRPIGAANWAIHHRALPISAEWVTEGGEIEDLASFDPFVVPAAGGQIYVFDKNTGRAGRFLSTWNASITARTYGTFERTPEYDLDELEAFDSFQIYLLPKGIGVGIVGRPVGEPDALLVREINFACHPRTSERDSTGDGVGDLIDNCPTMENPDQADLDSDSYGDACDPDIDGDGIVNSIDFATIDTGEVDEAGAPIFETVDTSRDSNNNGIDNEDDPDSDGDGIPDEFDPFPLDSSNNGTPNLWSPDASGNGINDSVLLGRSKDPYNYFSLLSGDTFAFLTEDSSGQRMLHYGDIAHPKATRVVSLPGTVNPHGLTFGTSSRYLVFLSGVPGVTERFMVYDTVAEAVIIDQPVYAPIRSVAMINTTTFLVTHEVEATGLWQVSRVTIDPNFSRTEEFSGLPHIWYADVNGSWLTLLAAETDCRECATAYRYDLANQTFHVLPGGTDEIYDIYTDQGLITLLTEGETFADPPRLRHLSLNGGSTISTVDLPEGFSRYYSVTFSRRQNNSGTPQDSLRPYALVAMRRWGQTPDLWLANQATGEWRLLLASPSSIVEVAWAP
jgi:hypothetical protein